MAAEAELKTEREAYEDKMRREALADLMPCRRLLDLHVEFHETIEQSKLSVKAPQCS
jgi:hypothetical protein